MIDYRKMLVAQIAACIDFDGGAPSIDGWFEGYVPVSNEELDAYDEICGEAQRLCDAFRKHND